MRDSIAFVVALLSIVAFTSVACDKDSDGNPAGTQPPVSTPLTPNPTTPSIAGPSRTTGDRNSAGLDSMRSYEYEIRISGVPQYPLSISGLLPASSRTLELRVEGRFANPDRDFLSYESGGESGYFVVVGSQLWRSAIGFTTGPEVLPRGLDINFYDALWTDGGLSDLVTGLLPDPASTDFCSSELETVDGNLGFRCRLEIDDIIKAAESRGDPLTGIANQAYDEAVIEVVLSVLGDPLRISAQMKGLDHQGAPFAYTLDAQIKSIGAARDVVSP